jgi:hypothetical protein
MKGCSFGNGAAGQPTNTLFCVRGVGELETHGLFFSFVPNGC